MRPHRPQRSRRWISTGWRGRSGPCSSAATVRIVGDRPQAGRREAVGRIGFRHGRGRCGRCGRLRPCLFWRGMARVGGDADRSGSAPGLRARSRSRCRSCAGRSPPGAAGPPAPEGYRARSWTWRRARPPSRPRAPRRSEAVPVHSVRVAITARTAAAIGSASITPSTASSRLPQ